MTSRDVVEATSDAERRPPGRRWLDARFGLDRIPDPVPARQPAMAGRGYPVTD